MKNTIQFSKRPLQKTSLDLRSSDVSIKRDFASTSTYQTNSKPLFKPDQQFLKRRSPDHTRSFFENRTNTNNICQSTTISNLKAELSSLKQQVNKLTGNCFEPLQFKSKLKFDKSVQGSSLQQLQENRSCEFKVDNDYYQQPKQIKNQQPEYKNQMTRIKSQYIKQDNDQTSQENMNGMGDPPLKLQILKARKHQEDLKNDLDEAKSTCRLFKQQADKLKQELKQASEREHIALEEKRNLIERLNQNRNDSIRETYERRLKECIDTFTRDKAKLENTRISQINQLKKQVSQLQKNNESLSKQLLRLQCETNKNNETSDEVLRRRDKQINILKQQIAILQQLTSTRVAEQNCLFLQKESMEKMYVSKDNENKRLQKDINDLKERLESERVFVININEKLAVKNQIIQHLESELNVLRQQLSLQLTIVKSRPLNEKSLIYSKIVNITVNAIVKKQQRRRITSTQTHTPHYQYENVQQQNEHKENLDIMRPKYRQNILDCRSVQRQTKHLTQLKFSNSRIIKHKDEHEAYPNPFAQYILDLEKQISLLKTTLSALEQTNQQLLKQDAKRIQQLTSLKSQVQLLKQTINDLNLNITSESEKHKAELNKVNNTNQYLSQQIDSLSLINEQLHREKVNLLAELENTKANSIKEADTLNIQLSHLKGQLQHNEHVIANMRSNITNLQHHTGFSDSLSRRLRKTQETLIESNDIIHRLNIASLSSRLEQQYIQHGDL